MGIQEAKFKSTNPPSQIVDPGLGKSKTGKGKFNPMDGDAVKRASKKGPAQMEKKEKLPTDNQKHNEKAELAAIQNKFNSYIKEAGSGSMLSYILFLMEIVRVSAKEERSARLQSRQTELKMGENAARKQRDAATSQFIGAMTSAGFQIAGGVVSLGGSIKAGKTQSKAEAEMKSQFNTAPEAPAVKGGEAADTAAKSATKTTADSMKQAADSGIKSTTKAQTAAQAKPPTEVEKLQKAAGDIKKSAQDLKKFSDGSDYREAQHAATNKVRTQLQMAEGASMLFKSLGDISSGIGNFQSGVEQAEASQFRDVEAKAAGYMAQESAEVRQSFVDMHSAIARAFANIFETRNRAISQIIKA